MVATTRMMGSLHHGVSNASITESSISYLFSQYSYGFVQTRSSSTHPLINVNRDDTLRAIRDFYQRLLAAGKQM